MSNDTINTKKKLALAIVIIGILLLAPVVVTGFAGEAPRDPENITDDNDEPQQKKSIKELKMKPGYSRAREIDTEPGEVVEKSGGGNQNSGGAKVYGFQRACNGKYYRLPKRN